MIKAVYYWHRDREIHQSNRIVIPEVEPYICDHVIFYKGSKTTKWGKEVFFTNGNGLTAIKVWEKRKLVFYLHLTQIIKQDGPCS